MSKQSVEKVQKLISSHKVFVASKTYCPYCAAAKKTLQSEVKNDLFILELNTIDDGAEIQDALAQITGQSTVPNIFIAGEHIGGNSDLQALGKARLEEKLIKAGAA
ncbi:hypothetical protein OGAPHI_003769 [Ogataea philodendri]|uniref:Glutaredoxin domain-containing protein n=1 Tax=Ogataea philodendri TaxID=1378263 RepID=A0A9P8P5I0_9ASCO|nr:uncharacterized protein OGAPHI_003769 [Ogataea philodendri]KAH3665582.1 hypothetical protein OGAPHI_003769 [Ogataea philodendri]